MQVVIADTSPVNYLVLIGRIDLLHLLFEKIVLPSIVVSELKSERAPHLVRHWISTTPAWFEVREIDSMANIDEGGRTASQLACTLNADLVLMDDHKGVLACWIWPPPEV